MILTFFDELVHDSCRRNVPRDLFITRQLTNTVIQPFHRLQHVLGRLDAIPYLRRDVSQECGGVSPLEVMNDFSECSRRVRTTAVHGSPGFIVIACVTAVGERFSRAL